MPLFSCPVVVDAGKDAGEIGLLRAGTGGMLVFSFPLSHCYKFALARYTMRTNTILPLYHGDILVMFVGKSDGFAPSLQCRSNRNNAWSRDTHGKESSRIFTSLLVAGCWCLTKSGGYL